MGMQDAIFDPLTADWNAAWKARQEQRNAFDDANYWDERAHTFNRKAGQSSYVKTFLEYAEIREGERVFDMGCGPGTLTIPLAQQGHHVTAVDFSGNMLGYLQAEAAEKGLLDNIRCVQASWEDDWAAAGIEQADVAIASRSIAVADLERALRAFDAMANRRACLTVTAEDSPRFDAVLWKALGRSRLPGMDYIYCVNILFNMGYKPEVRYIKSAKLDSFASMEDARASIRRPLRDVKPEEEERLERFLEQHIVSRVTDEGETVFSRDYPLPVNWVFIAWDKD